MSLINLYVAGVLGPCAYTDSSMDDLANDVVVAIVINVVPVGDAEGAAVIAVYNSLHSRYWHER